MNYRFFLEFFLFFPLFVSAADKIVVHGFVFSGADSLPLSGVKIYSPQGNDTIYSDVTGEFYLEDQPDRKYFFTKPNHHTGILTLSKGQPGLIKVYLVSGEDYYLKKTIVKTIRRPRVERLVDRNDLYKAASVNQGDLFQPLKALPGVVSNNELTSEFSVRGSNIEFNKVFINGLEVYKPYQLRNNYQANISLVDDEIVDNIQFYSSRIPVSFGNSLTSVTDIQTKRESDQFRGLLNLDFIKNSFFITAPAGEKFVYFAGLRKFRLSTLSNDYSNLFQFLIDRKDPDYSIDFNRQIFDLYDGQTGFSWKINPQFSLATVSLGSYRHIDLFAKTQKGNQTPKTYDEESYEMIGIQILNSQYQWNDQLKVLSGGVLQRLKNDMRFQYIYPNAVRSQSSLSLDLAGWMGQAEWKVAHQHVLRPGFDIYYLKAHQNIDENNANKFADSVLVDNNFIKSYRWSGFISDQWQLKDGWSTTSGLRVSYYTFNKEWNLLPRLSFQYNGPWETIWEGSFEAHAQDPSHSEYTGPLQPDQDILRSQKLRKWNIGGGKKWNDILDLQVNLFYHQYRDLIERRYENNFIEYFGKNEASGSSQGAEIRSFLKPNPYFQGEMSLTILKSEEKRNGSSILYPQSEDQHYTLRSFLQITPVQKVERFKINVEYVYGSGMPFTPKILLSDSTVEYGAINSERYPSFQRLDFKLLIDEKGPDEARLHFIKNIRAYIVFLNVLDHKNVLRYEYIQRQSTLERVALSNAGTSRRFRYGIEVVF